MKGLHKEEVYEYLPLVNLASNMPKDENEHSSVLVMEKRAVIVVEQAGRSVRVNCILQQG